MTRFIDTFVYKGYLTRQPLGKISEIFQTKEGQNLQKLILDAWKHLHQRYAKVLGSKEGDELNKMIDIAIDKLNKQV